MAISRDTQNQLAKGNFESIEDAWLQRIDAAPEDTEFFVGTARALVGTGEEKRARSLMELLDEELRGRALWRPRLELLRRAAALFLPADKIHAAILSTLRKLHTSSPSFTGLAEAVGLNRAPDDLPKTWEKVARLETLLSFDLGAIVWMEGKGAGRVIEVNLGLESFKVDFERNKGTNVGFRAAGKLLKPLPDGHILRRKIEDPAGLTQLREQDPTELLRLVLASQDRPFTAAEIREDLAGVVSEAQWSSWWNAARKHPQLVVSGSGRQVYSWAATSEDATGALWKSFEKAPVAQQIDRLRRDGSRDLELRRRMAAILIDEAAQAAERNPALAFEIWFALERNGGAPADASWSPAALLSPPRDPRFLAAVGDRLLRERGYTMVRERRDDWRTVFAAMLGREEDSRALDTLAEGLRREAPHELDRFLDQTLAQPRRAPAAFVWLAELAASDETVQLRNPLRLLQQILAVLSADEFSPFRSRLKALCDPGGTVPRLLSHLTAEQALQAQEALQRASGLDDYQRQPLLNALHLRFPVMRQEKNQPLYARPESIAEKRAELQRLLEVEIPANRKAIEEARAMGDLRENFEYKSARQRHEYLSGLSAQLDAQLRRARPLDPAQIDTAETRVGTRLELRAAGGATRRLTILGPWESKPEEDILSYESELAAGMLGKKCGETVEIDGVKYTIGTIKPYA